MDALGVEPRHRLAKAAAARLNFGLVVRIRVAGARFELASLAYEAKLEPNSSLPRCLQHIVPVNSKFLCHLELVASPVLLVRPKTIWQVLSLKNLTT